MAFADAEINSLRIAGGYPNCKESSRLLMTTWVQALASIGDLPGACTHRCHQPFCRSALHLRDPLMPCTTLLDVQDLGIK